jgi:hypothetical protein
MFKEDSLWLVFKPFLWKDKDMKPECKGLLKAYESLSEIQSKYDEDFPEMLSYMYLLVKGYWTIENGETKEVKTPPFTTIALLKSMQKITEMVRNGTTIEDIVNEKELCGDTEEI